MIKVENLKKQYGDNVVLKDISLYASVVRPASNWCVLGKSFPNGKTGLIIHWWLPPYHLELFIAKGTYCSGRPMA